MPIEPLGALTPKLAACGAALRNAQLLYHKIARIRQVFRLAKKAAPRCCDTAYRIRILRLQASKPSASLRSYARAANCRSTMYNDVPEFPTILIASMILVALLSSSTCSLMNHWSRNCEA